MAELVKVEGDAQKDAVGAIECPVCLQGAVYPAELPCGHIVCFLCVKGIKEKDNRCALCRQDIPEDFTQKPKLLLLPAVTETAINPAAFQWFYKGGSGWWQFDKRSSAEIEQAYSKGDRLLNVLIAGNVYIINFNEMTQSHQAHPSRCRRIKRDVLTASHLGVAGLTATTLSSIQTLDVNTVGHPTSRVCDNTLPFVPGRRSPRRPASYYEESSDEFVGDDDMYYAGSDDSEDYQYEY